MDELITVLLVEDEHLILDDILSMVDWQAEGFRVVGTASNGKQGLMAFQEKQPQLVIADIRMPIMDGLEMMREIRTLDKTVSCCFLSSYSEFEYAQEAVRLSADSYILKSEISPAYFHEILAPIREKIKSRQTLQRYTAGNRLLTILSGAADPEEEKTDDEALLPDYFDAYYESESHDTCLRRISRVIRECYTSLGVGDQFSACEATEKVQLLQWMLGEYRRICNLCHAIYEENYSPIIIKASEYIRANFSNPDLRIALIADHVNLSVSRLSVLFKQETGKTVNDSITEIRINEAKRLLRSGNYKVYEVSWCCGYKTSQYFSQVFCQYTGFSPTEYLRGGGR